MRPLALLLAAVVPLCTTAQDTPADPPDTTALIAQIESGDVPTEDLRLQLRFRQNERGLVRVHTFDEGPTIFASVVRGQPVDYLGLDTDGRALPLTEAETEFGGEVSCWRCATGDAAACWQVLCVMPRDS